MTLEDIRNYIEKIKVENGDDQTQHGLEDELHREFIRYVSLYDSGKLSMLAKEILLVDNMPFARWCA